MDQKIRRHPLAFNAIKLKLWKNCRQPRLSTDGPTPLPAGHRDDAADSVPQMHPWMGLFDDPALHEALDRIMAGNGIA